jgi:hypothetical protein
MNLNAARAVIVADRRRMAAVAAIAVVLGGTGLTGCGLASAVKRISGTVSSDRAAINAFTGKLQSGQATPFAATYVTTGSSPATIVYAVQPPKGLAFTDFPAGGSSVSQVHIIANSSGEYFCTPPAPPVSPRWLCQKLNAVTAADRNKIFSFYTPAHWVAFLKGLSIAAGLAGDKITSSTMTVNGFSMSCIDLRASGIPGTSTICTTAQGILGYVKVAGSPTSFEIKSYTASPSPSLFRLPPGAKITTRQTGAG